MTSTLIPTKGLSVLDSRRIRRAAAALALASVTLGGLAACSEDEGVRPTTSATSPLSATATAQVPTAQELTDILNRASDPATPLDQKTNLVEGGQESPEVFDQIAKLKAEKGATVEITSAAEGDTPGTVIANAVIKQAGQQDVNVQAQFIQQDGQWKLHKQFACALITNAGLQAPASCPAA